MNVFTSYLSFTLRMLLAAHFIFGHVAQAQVGPAIVGGTEAPAGKYPWIAQWGGCGGTMISGHVLLTAVHCFNKDSLNGNEMVMVGGTDLTDKSQFYETTFDKSTAMFWGTDALFRDDENAEPDYFLDKDIALVCLNERIPGDSWPQLAPGDHADYANINALIAGWGDTAFEGSSSDKLLEATVPTYSAAGLLENFEGFEGDFNPETMIPAGGAKVTTCQGDSGGPLFLESSFETSPTILGITSWGKECDSPAIFASVPAARSWILEGMKKCKVPTKVATKPGQDDVSPTPSPKPSPKPGPGDGQTFPNPGTCKIITASDAHSHENQKCSDCQWKCLGHDRCKGIEFNGYPVPRDQLPYWNCGDGRWPLEKNGLCVQFDKHGKISNVMESDCGACRHKCDADNQACSAIAFNFEAAQRSDLNDFC